MPPDTDEVRRGVAWGAPLLSSPPPAAPCQDVQPHTTADGDIPQELGETKVTVVMAIMPRTLTELVTITTTVTGRVS